MPTSVRTKADPRPTDVRVTNDTLAVDLDDGRTISVPLVWFPRLLHGTPKERSNFHIGPVGIHWPDLDEDISVAGLLRGEKSGESMNSLKRWLDYRSRGQRVPVPTFPLPDDMAKMLEKERHKPTPRRKR